MKRDKFQAVTEMPLLWLAMAGLALLIFIADTVTDLEIAVAVLHVVVVLISVSTGRPRAVLIVGMACGLLTVLSYAMTPRGDVQAGIANTGLALLAIGATTYLAIRIELADLAIRRAEADLARIARITMLGELTASIAHEVSQPLAAIGASSHAALRWLDASPPDQAEARQALARIVEAAGRAGEVVERVRRLVRRTPPSRQPVDVIAVIEETLALMRGRLRANAIVLESQLLRGPLAVMGDRVELQQVLINFITNAIEAVLGQGSESRMITVNTAADDRQVTVSVGDSGPGLTPQAMERVFDAFFTTKEDGMGIGLAISRSIVEAHGGRIEAGAAMPGGSVFRFTLPLVRASG